MQNEALALLRHTVATLAYRGGKTLRGATAEFANFRAAEKSRTPAEILAHIGDLLDWAVGLADGKSEWHDSPPLSLEQGTARFHAGLEAFDRRLASGQPLGCTAEKLFQGPIADALTHVGQLAMLRNLAGCKMKGENYQKAEITAGRVGTDQAAPRFEF